MLDIDDEILEKMIAVELLLDKRQAERIARELSKVIAKMFGGK